MNTGHHSASRMIVARAARTLVKEAREAAAACQQGSPDWSVYHGVEAAAHHVIHPEAGAVRDCIAWLDGEEPSFRDGVLVTTSLRSIVTACPDPPLHVRLPVPEPRSTRRHA